MSTEDFLKYAQWEVRCHLDSLVGGLTNLTTDPLRANEPTLSTTLHKIIDKIPTKCYRYSIDGENTTFRTVNIESSQCINVYIAPSQACRYVAVAAKKQQKLV